MTHVENNRCDSQRQIISFEQWGGVDLLLYVLIHRSVDAVTIPNAKKRANHREVSTERKVTAQTIYF